jgi:hypothetical protein
LEGSEKEEVMELRKEGWVRGRARMDAKRATARRKRKRRLEKWELNGGINMFLPPVGNPQEYGIGCVGMPQERSRWFGVTHGGRLLGREN